MLTNRAAELIMLTTISYPPSDLILPKGYIALADALHQIGSHLMPDTWEWNDVDSGNSETYEDKLPSRVAMWKQVQISINEVRGTPIDTTNLDNDVEQHVRNVLDESNELPRDRFNAVEQWIFKHLREAELTVVAMLTNGRLEDLPDYFWNGAGVRKAIVKGQIFLKDNDFFLSWNKLDNPKIAYLIVNKKNLTACLVGDAYQASISGSKGIAKKKCHTWLSELMKSSLGKKTDSKSNLRNKAIKEISDLTKRGFDDAWAKAIESTGAINWSKPGRPH